MRILYVGDGDSRIVPFLRSLGEDVVVTAEKLEESEAVGFDFLVSYRYRHILKKNILALFPGRAINIHNGYLPWNKGADANLWSHIEGTPKGVTVHLIDEGIDTGDILVQKVVHFTDADTLATSWSKLWDEAQNVFIDNWEKIRSGEIVPQKQEGEGTFHYAKEKERVYLKNGWDTLISELSSSEMSNTREDTL